MGIYRTFNMLKNLKNWNSYLLYKIRGKKEDIFEFRLKNDFIVKVQRDVLHEFKESVFEQVYFKRLPKKIYSIKNPTVIDIGANVGFFTIFSEFKLNNPLIYSFEPIQRNFKMLLNNLEKTDKSRIISINKAVSNTEGELILKFNYNQDITTSASIFDNKFGNDEEKVSSTTLQNIVDKFKIEKIDLLKLDCEGAEYSIFYDTPKSLFEIVNCIALETHNGAMENQNTNELAEYIKNLGFGVAIKPNFIWAYKPAMKWK